MGMLDTVEGIVVEKKKRPLVIRYIVIAVVIFWASVLISILTRTLLVTNSVFPLTEEQAGLVTGMIEGAVGAIAAGFVLYELKLSAGVEARQNDIEEAQFLLEYNQAFIQDEKMCAVEQRLEQWMEGRLPEGEPLINDDNRQRFINYLVYLEGLAPLIFRDILKLEHIDDLMAYRFFLALNNPELQEDQIFRYPEYFRGCVKLYAIWKNYRTQNGHPTPLSEYALDRWHEFEKYSESPVVVRKLKAGDDLKQVAGLVYDTDPFIYPAAFGSRRRAMRVLPRLMSTDCIFHADNFRVAELNGEIVGVALVVDDPSQAAAPPLDCGCPVGSYADVRERYFATIPDAISSISNSAHLACLCVKQERRGRRIGEILLKRVIQEYREKGRSAISLDVLADNPVAVRLYQNYGFKQEEAGLGYAYHEEKPTCWRMVLRFPRGVGDA